MEAPARRAGTGRLLAEPLGGEELDAVFAGRDGGIVAA
jgi:hypothetical protein